MDILRNTYIFTFSQKSLINSFSIYVIPSLLILFLSSQCIAAADPLNEFPEIRAQLSPKTHTTISSELDAKISKIHTNEGDAFKQGKTIVEFDCSLQKFQLKKAQASLSVASNTLKGNMRLAELGGIGKVQLNNSRSEVTKARADLNYLNALIKKCSIKAPFNGRLDEKLAQEKQFVKAGQALLEIFDDSTLELVFIVPSRWLRWLKPDLPFKIIIDETGNTYPAKVLKTSARVDPVSQSIKIYAIIDGKFPELMAGMSGNVLFEGQ